MTYNGCPRSNAEAALRREVLVMPRPLWKGAISFGMVSIPIKVYSATEEKDVRFNMLHAADHSRVKQKLFCADEDIEIEGVVEAGKLLTTELVKPRM